MKKRHVVGKPRRNMRDVKDWHIDEVLAGAYRGKFPAQSSLQSHMAGDLPDGGQVVLCGSVKPDSLCNDGYVRPNVLTCPKCIERWGRLHPGVSPPQRSEPEPP